MILFPAIDIKDGSCVRLVQGKMEDVTIFNEDPADQAKIFELKKCKLKRPQKTSFEVSCSPKDLNRLLLRSSAKLKRPLFKGGLSQFSSTETRRLYLFIYLSRCSRYLTIVTQQEGARCVVGRSLLCHGKEHTTEWRQPQFWAQVELFLPM